MQIIKFLVITILLTSVARADDNLGEYNMHASDCAACHTVPGKEPFAGGLPINSPFGTIYSTNITPDEQYGIGNYSLADFTRLMREGIANDGRHIYPAMPYTSYAGMSDQDIAALYDYFMHQVKPVNVQPPQTRLPFPFNQRWGLRFWNLFFHNDKTYQAKNDHDAEWNRGAYLAETMGHCSGCHNPRGIAYQEKYRPDSKKYLTGMVLDHWYAPTLRQDPVTGLGKWSADDIAAFLKNGHAQGGVAFGNMAQVVEESTQYLTDDDRQAIAHYLVSMADDNHHDSYPAETTQSEFEKPGAGLYANDCASCHKADGSGNLPRYPKLAGNPVVVSKDPTSLIRIVLDGGASPKVDGGPPVARMPGFAKKYTDQEVAEVVTYIRQSWGNNAGAVTVSQVESLRKSLQNDSKSDARH